MSDSDCSNCSEDKCPYKKDDHYDCYKNKVISAKQLSPDIITKFIEIREHIKKIQCIDTFTFLDDELSNLQYAIEEILILNAEGDT